MIEVQIFDYRDFLQLSMLSLLLSYTLNEINGKNFIALKTTNVIKLQIDLQKDNDLPR